MLLETAAAVQDYMTSPSTADQIGAAGISAWIIDTIKKSNKIPWINEHSAVLNRLVSFFFALSTTLLINFAWGKDPTGAHAGGILMIGLPSFPQFMGAAWKTASSYVMQQGSYQLFFKHEPGLQAADAVGDLVEANKEKIAEAVAQRDATVLGLREPIQKRDDHLNRSEPELEDKPIDWGFKKK